MWATSLNLQRIQAMETLKMDFDFSIQKDLRS